jgi:uncharacterized protein
MLIVSDTSPIINLAAIGLLQLIPELFGEVFIPDAVYHEIVVVGAGEPGSEEIKEADWAKVVSVSDLLLLSKLMQRLDPGEAEAIVLALDLKARFILMDESAGRSVATSHDLEPLGTLGILLKAKKAGLISAVTPVMDKLRAEAHFFISPSLYQFIKTTADE